MAELHDLESVIMASWSTRDDVDILCRTLLDGEGEMSKDEIANALMGISALHEMRSKELFGLFEKMLAQNKST